MSSPRFSSPQSSLAAKPGSSSLIERFWRRSLGITFNKPLNRVAVLGDNNYGHLSCVNALSWTHDGRALLSGGDDRTVRIWSMDPSQDDSPYPFVCTSVIHTGHRANIFNAQPLPHSDRIASVAGDKQIRVFEAALALSPSTRGDREIEYHSSQLSPRVLRCHTDRVKRIVTEDSPDMFLTVSEDGSVRQHDLRVPHTCAPRGSCPAPLVQCQFELSTLSLSPLTPYQFVVAGESPYGYLFDRRHVGRVLKEEWGFAPEPSATDLALCVRRFGRDKAVDVYRPHITGAKMSSHHSHEVLLSYSGDGIYLYSTRDDPHSAGDPSPQAILPPNSAPAHDPIPISSFSTEHETLPAPIEDDDALPPLYDEPEVEAEAREDEDMEDFSDIDEQMEYYPNSPIVLPRKRYVGAANVETVKDVNFLGSEDELVVSGSDDGNFFVWRKDTGTLQGIYEGDGSVVNVVEQHPYWPLIAVSGIDATVKLFSPGGGTDAFCNTERSSEIMSHNSRRGTQQLTRGQFALIRAALGADVGDSEGPCNVQ